MHVEPYSSHHRDELRAICLANAGELAQSNPTEQKFTLLMYCDPYLELGTAYVLLDDAGIARGYILCAEDYGRWRHDFAPYARCIANLSPDYERRMLEELAYYESVSQDYPAHLHIDIQEDYTGVGGGRQLMEALIAQLREHGVKGVTFGVSALNERAVGFYQHLGFDLLTEYGTPDDPGYTFGMRFT